MKVKDFVLSRFFKLQTHILCSTLLFFLFLHIQPVCSQVEAIPAGSFIVNMGITPQTVGNALKPYGMLYDLIKNYQVGVKRVINPSKSKDGVDFTHNGISYKGGPFIIIADFRNSAVNGRIAYWQSQGVVGATSTAELMLPVEITFTTVPRWTMDKQNGQLAVPNFVNAGIPSSAHGGSNKSSWKDPSELDCCDDIFVLPHADPIWSTHQRLYTWNLECRGNIWNGCHSGSSLENMLNPDNRSQQSNFLTQKDPAYTGSSGNYANSNSLILWGDHSDGSPPYNHRLPADPVSQYIGTTDAAYQNGAEQIFIPRQTSGTSARWNPGAKIICYDPVHTNVPSPHVDLRNAAVALIYGRGFDDPNRGYVMHNAAHSISKSTDPAYIAAQRAFFNYSWVAAQDKAENLSISNGGGSGGIVYSGNGRTFTFSIPSGNYSNFSIMWNSSCGGSFTPNQTSQDVTFIAPSTESIANCVITLSLTDQCGRTTTTSFRTAILCNYVVTHTETKPSCFGGNNGTINISTSGESSIGTNTWNWLKVGTAQTGSGTASSITGLSSGSYNVTVTSQTNCTATFTALVSDPPIVAISATARNYSCFGETGLININVTGGTLPYSYLWNGGITTRNRDGLIAGTYTLTVTDANGCTKTSVSSITGQTSAFTAQSSKTDITCFGLTNGIANITTNGGTGPFTYLWTGGNTAQNRTGLSTGSYVVTVTDASNCSATTSVTILQPTILTAQIQAIPPSCPPEASSPQNSDGSITLTASGGTPPYTYLWENAATTQNRTGLVAGTYTVTITDNKGCQNIKSATLVATNQLPNAPTGIIK